MGKSSYLKIEMDEQGHWILPPELLAQYGITPGALVRVEQGATEFRISRSSSHLGRVYIEPTNTCNLGCATCMRNAWDEPLGKMSAETFSRILASVEQISPRPSIFFGGYGEPLIHPQIVERAAAAKQAGCCVELITNGILLSPEISAKLIEIGVDRVWVSLDGATPESYADVRLGNTLPRVLANLAALQKQLRQKKASAPKLGIAFVAMKRNISDLPKVIELGKQLGADQFSISNVLPHTPEMRDEALYMGPHNGEPFATQWTPLLSFTRMEFNAHTIGPILEALNKGGPVEIARQEVKQGANTCPFAEKGSLSVRWDGAVSPCLALLHDHENYLDFRKRTTQAHTVGHLKAQDLTQIWNTPSYVALRDRLLTFDFAFCTMCNSCHLADSNQEDCFGSPAPACGACLWAQGLVHCP